MILSTFTHRAFIGIEFEKANLGKIVSTNPQIKVVYTDRGIKKVPMAAYHHHDEEGEHHKKAELPEEGDLCGQTGTAVLIL